MINSDDTVFVGRNIAARRAIVFSGWTDPDVLGNWLIPEVCAIKSARVDARLGGDYSFSLAVPDSPIGQTLSGQYTEFVPEERIVKTWILCAEDADIAEATVKILTADFTADVHGGTRVDVTHKGETDPMTRVHLKEILDQCLGKLGRWAESQR